MEKLILMVSAFLILISGDISVVAQDKAPDESAMLAASKCDVATAKTFFTNDIRNKSLSQYKGDMLRVAVEVDCTELFDFLLAVGADVNAKAKNGGGTPLMTAALFGRANLAKRLLAAGADVNARNDSGWTALKIAVLRRKQEIIKVLLGAGADTTVKDERGNSLLIDAATLGDIALVNHFAAAGVDINAGNKDGWTALVYVACGSDTEMLKALIAAGADANQKDKEGKTPLMWAAASGSIRSVKELISIGVDVNAIDKNEKSALDYAAEAKENSAEIVRLLKGAGAIDKAPLIRNRCLTTHPTGAVGWRRTSSQNSLCLNPSYSATPFQSREELSLLVSLSF